MSNAPYSSVGNDDGSPLLQDIIMDECDDNKKSSMKDTKESPSSSSSSIELHAYHYNLPSPCNDHPEWTIDHFESLTDELTTLIDVDLSKVKEPLVNKKITRVYSLIMSLIDLKYPLSLILRRSIIKRCLELFIITKDDITITDDGSYHYHLVQPIVTIPPNTPTPPIILRSPSPNNSFSPHLSPPTRDKLLQITLALLDKKTAFPSSSPPLLIIHWQTLLHQLFFEQPHLHHQNTSHSPPTSSSHITSSIHRRYVMLISSSRRFFDASSKEIYDLFQWNDDPETILSFRNLALRTLFLPTSPLMTPRVETWVREWSTIPRNSHWDYCFLILLSRARKFASRAEIWATVGDVIVARLGYWLQLPLGGFDDAKGGGGSVASGSFPSRLRVLLLRGNDGDLVQRFVKKISKLLVFGLSYPSVVQKVIRFFKWSSPFLHPSNSGRWVYGLVGLLGSFSFCLAERVGRGEVGEGEGRLDGGDVVMLLDALYPLIFQAIYSKSSHVERLGLESFTNLLPIATSSILPYTISFSLQALSHASIHSAHQAPSALSLLKRVVIPGLRFCPDIIIPHLDEVLHASLPGLDGNDSKKTTRALGLYSHLMGYVCCYPTDDDAPLSRGSFPSIEYTPHDYSHSPPFQKNLSSLPSTSPLLSPTPPSSSSISVSTPIQSIAPHIFHRLTTLLSTLGPREKTNNHHHHAAPGDGNIGHYLSQIDHDNKRAFSIQLEQCLSNLVHSLSPEDGIWMRRFLEEFLNGDGGLLPHAAKDVGGFCRAVMSGDNMAQGLDLLMRVWVLEKKSPKSILRYRVRVIANAIRYSGREVLRFQKEFNKLLDISLGHEDKGVRKSGCKLLRHLLGCLVECYPMDWRVRVGTGGEWGSGAELKETEGTLWHSPTGEEIDYAVDLLRRYPLTMMEELTEDDDSATGSLSSSRVIIEKWRSTVKVLHYALRGAIRIIIDNDVVNDDSAATPLNAYMKATLHTISLYSPSSRDTLHNLRSKLSSRLVQIVSLICHVAESSSSSPPTTTVELFSDAKLAKEVLSCLELLSCLYGANPHHLDLLERTHDERTFLARDVVLQSHYRYIRKSMGDSKLMERGLRLLKNGEGGGKRQSWDMIMNRLWMHYERLQCATSQNMPRRIRLQSTGENTTARVYKNMVMGVLNLCCHESIVIRGLARHSLEMVGRYHYWMVREVLGRLLAAINLDDLDVAQDDDGFVIPSCAKLAMQSKNDRDGPSAKRLAVTLRGIGNILQLKKCMKDIVSNIHHRAVFIKSMVGVQRLLEAVPEDHASMIQLVMNTLFLQFRSMWYEIEARRDEEEEVVMMDCLLYLMKNMDGDDNEMSIVDEKQQPTLIKSTPLNWKYKLINLWFLMILTSQSLLHSHPNIPQRLLSILITIIETERGQPIQRLALGFLSRLTQFHQPSSFIVSLRETIPTCLSSLTHALTLNHRSNVSHDGHKAQWSKGVEEIMRDASHNIQCKTLHYPGVSRVSVRSGKLKSSHMQFVERLLGLVGSCGGKEWLVEVKELVNAPPSEDQQNEQCTAAEIFGGVCRVLVWEGGSKQKNKANDTEEDEKMINKEAAWDSVILPFLDQVLTNLPTDPVMYWCDSLRYVFYDRMAGDVAPLLNWLISKVEESTKAMIAGGKQQTVMSDGGSSNGITTTSLTTIDGFSSQSKWLMILSSLLVDINWSVYTDDGEDDDVYAQKPFSFHPAEIKGLLHVWTTIKDKLLPLLLGMLEHPYEACRNGIASCLFRICQTQRQIVHLIPYENWMECVGDARGMVVTAFRDCLTVEQNINDGEKQKGFHHYTRITLSRFFSYCIHSGDDKRDYSDIIIPLLPLAFESVDVSQHHVNNNNTDGTTTKNSNETANNTAALDNDVTKSFRIILSFIATNCLISHGNSHDISSILQILKTYSQSSVWQIRSLSAQFLKCFQSRHFFLFDEATHTTLAMEIVKALLSDERREVSSAAMVALTGILSVTPVGEVEEKVKEVIPVADRSMKKKTKKKKTKTTDTTSNGSSSSTSTTPTISPRERQRMKDQQTSVFFLCAAVLSRPYDTPPFVPDALEALSKHSFESRATMGVREVVKKCFSEYKRTHVDNWELHRSQFTREQLDAMADVVSTPHYYA